MTEEIQSTDLEKSLSQIKCKSGRWTIEEIVQMKKAGLSKPADVTHSEWNAPIKLSPLHEKICYLAAIGKGNSFIASECGMGANRVSIVLNSIIGKYRISKLQFEIYGKNPQKRFTGMVDGAIDTIKTIMEDPTASDGVRRGCANDVLDRSMGKPKQQIEHRTSTLMDLYVRLDEALPVKKVQALQEKEEEIIEAEFEEITKKEKEELDKEFENVDDFMEKQYGK